MGTMLKGTREIRTGALELDTTPSRKEASTPHRRYWPGLSAGGRI
jgi:hypothetical protein